VPPTVSITAPAADAILGGPSQTTVTATATITGATTVTAHLGLGVPVTATHGAGNTWTAQLPLPNEDYSAETITFNATDAAGNPAQATRQVYVDRVAPTVAFTFPAGNQKFNAADLATTNNVTALFTVTDGDTQRTGEGSTNGTTWAAGTTVTTTTSATDNPRSYTAYARGRDRAGNVGTVVTVAFSVDRVAPTVTQLLPADGTRNVEPRQATVTFSEPVQGAMASSDGLVVTPTATGAGTWNGTHSTYTTPPLAPYTVYAATVPVNLADAYGNTLTAAPTVHFHTVAATPASGTVLFTSVSGANFDAVSDPDGVPFIGRQALASPYPYTATRFDPVTGQPETAAFYSYPNPPSGFIARLGAWSTPQGDLSAQRVAGIAAHLPGMVALDFATYQVGSAAQVTETARTAFIPTPPIVSGGVDGTGTIGTVVGLNYQRAGATALALAGAPQFVVAASTTRWATLRQSGTTLTWEEYACDSFLQWSCLATPFSVTTNGSALDTASAAMSPRGGCFTVAFEGPAGRRLAWQGPHVCDRFGCSPGAVTQQAASAGLRVAPFAANGQDALVGAWDTGTGIQVGVQTSCGAGFTPVGNPLVLPSLVGFRPMQIGNKPGLVYIDSSWAVKVYIP